MKEGERGRLGGKRKRGEERERERDRRGRESTYKVFYLTILENYLIID